MEYAIAHVQPKCPQCRMLLDASQFDYGTGAATCSCGWAGEASTDLSWYIDRHLEVGASAPTPAKPARRRKK